MLTIIIMGEGIRAVPGARASCAIVSGGGLDVSGIGRECSS